MSDTARATVARFFPLDDVVTALESAGLPGPPPWRDFAARRPDLTTVVVPRDADPEENRRRGEGMVVTPEVADAVNAALLLRRPLLVTGKPGIGKSSLAYAVAHRLKLGRVLVWPITSRSTLKQGLYDYDAVARLENASRRFYERRRRPPAPAADGDDGIGRYVRLGPLGTALLPTDLPQVLLIDEIDKCDVDLPNDLLHVFEEGRYRIDELARLPDEAKYATVDVFPHDADTRVPVPRAGVACKAFPVVILTSNAEREFPPAFNRRCVRLTIPEPKKEQLTDIVTARLFRGVKPAAWLADPANDKQVANLVKLFLDLRTEARPGDPPREQAVDQLLNAAHLMWNGFLEAKSDLAAEPAFGKELRELVFQSLTDSGRPEGP